MQKILIYFTNLIFFLLNTILLLTKTNISIIIKVKFDIPNLNTGNFTNQINELKPKIDI